MCGNPNRQLWMLLVTFESKMCRQLGMLLVEREKGLPNLFTFVKGHCSKINPGYTTFLILFYAFSSVTVHHVWAAPVSWAPEWTAQCSGS